MHHPSSLPAGLSRYYDPDTKEHYLATSRRTLLRAGAAGAGLALLGGGAVSVARAQGAADSAATAATGICLLTPELTEGPYYLDDMILREDVTEGKAGLPLALKLLVLDATTCEPIANAAVEIWHCDANGFYSGFVNNNPGGGGAYVDDGANPDTFLRGLQLTGDDGYVVFRTIYPGWYAGRDIHIHLKVHVGGEATNGSYDGGHVSHTGQLAFDDAISDEVAQIEPYSQRTSTFTRLEDDGVFGGIEEDDPAYFLTLTPVNPAALADGMTGEITLGIDPTVTQSGSAPGNRPPARN